MRAPHWLLLCTSVVHGWINVSVTEYGAIGDNATDNTAAFRSAAAAVAAASGGQLLVPAGDFKTAPFNLSSNALLRVEGTVWGVESLANWPKVAGLPSYASPDAMPGARYHPLVWAVNASNVSVAGSGTINGAGIWWWRQMTSNARPHIMEMHNVTGVDISGVTLQNSAFWTLRPWLCTNVHIHDMRILAPWPNDPGGVLNADGIDCDSSQHVVIERNFLSVGDDHVTILSGAGAAGRAFGVPSRNVTVQDNVLGTGMGLSVGSSVSGGVEDVVFRRNVMTERAGDWGAGAHIKTRITYGGYIRNIAFLDNVFHRVATAGLWIETDYQSKGNCTAETCTEIRDIVFRNFTVQAPSGTGYLNCYAARPCQNITLDGVHINSSAWGQGSCNNVASGTFTDVTPPGLAKVCGLD